jgi:hypothetical protein
MDAAKPTLLYLRGEPGSGKLTIATHLKLLLDWEHVWFHDLYSLPNTDPVEIARRVLPGLADHLRWGKSLIFSRPSRLATTVECVEVMARHCGYDVFVARLTASRETLLQRVEGRKKLDWRVSDEAGLDRYLHDGGAEAYLGERVYVNDGIEPFDLAERIADDVMEESWKCMS